MKCLLRWTIGPVDPAGFDALKQSVFTMRNLYDFNLRICYNNISESQLKTLERLGVVLVDSTKYRSTLKADPQDAKCPHAWKFCPPRLSPDTHEIIMDNDIILEKRVPEIDAFLTEDCILMTEGWDGFHGPYQIPSGLRLNTGIIGLPPHYNLQSNLNNLVHEWKSQFYDQGAMGKLMLDYGSYRVIPITTIVHIRDYWDNEHQKQNLGRCGCHFIGLNRGERKSFDKYRAEQLML